jgi:hypothetical protein
MINTFKIVFKSVQFIRAFHFFSFSCFHRSIIFLLLCTNKYMNSTHSQRHLRCLLYTIQKYFSSCYKYLCIREYSKLSKHIYNNNNQNKQEKKVFVRVLFLCFAYKLHNLFTHKWQNGNTNDMTI